MGHIKVSLFIDMDDPLEILEIGVAGQNIRIMVLGCLRGTVGKRRVGGTTMHIAV
ncbi:hypothetical protein [Rhizobium leguminosarum]|uniref:hypothetical protein n=1 Tax=Rhizobium leguminosarum TaxID=384 RepID=UPI00155979ED|nr:hypothetical protein [Rhizobium leguminosarum]